MHSYHYARVQLCQLAFQQYLIEVDPYRKANRFREWSDHCVRLGLSVPEFLSAAGLCIDARVTEDILGRIQKLKSGASYTATSSSTNCQSKLIPTLSFACQHCGAAFATQKQLNGHQKAHRK